MASDAELTTIFQEGERIIDVGRAAPDRTVPQYPTWTLRDLVAHVGEVHGRTLAICRTLPQDRIAGPEPPPDERVFDWASGILHDMVAAFSSADPDAAVWTFLPDKRLAAWQRRMVIETGVHRWDAEGAVGEPEPLLELVATAGLDEFGANYLPRLVDVPTLELADPALGRSWRYGDGPPGATASGTASDHYMRLMSRPGTQLPPAWEAAVDALETPADAPRR